jgi:hypothetical protein
MNAEGIMKPSENINTEGGRWRKERAIEELI